MSLRMYFVLCVPSADSNITYVLQYYSFRTRILFSSLPSTYIPCLTYCLKEHNIKISIKNQKQKKKKIGNASSVFRRAQLLDIILFYIY